MPPASQHHNQSFVDSWRSKQASHQPQTPGVAAHRNISSEADDKAEVDNIAHQVEHSFKTPLHVPTQQQAPQAQASPIMPTIIPTPNQPQAPEEVPFVPPAPITPTITEHMAVRTQHNGPEDTISIDQDGNFLSHDEA
jgi:hypothetical protein